jgi:uncharacterized LabA/DUF88 family protein
MLKALTPVRSALFIDYDNFRSLAAPLAKTIPNWVAWLEDGKFADGRRRKFVQKNAYWHPVNGTQEDAFRALGFKTKDCIYLAGSKIDTSAVDLHLAVDAVALACARKPPEEIIILASDSDYFPIVELLNDNNVRSIIVLSSRDASHNYESVATTLIRAHDLLAACAYERKPSFWARFRKKPKTETIAMATPARVAEAVAKAALALGAPLSMKSIFRVLQDLPGFKKNGPDAYFGFGSLNRLVRDIAHRRPDLKVWRGARGLVIQAKAKPA